MATLCGRRCRSFRDPSAQAPNPATRARDYQDSPPPFSRPSTVDNYRRSFLAIAGTRLAAQKRTPAPQPVNRSKVMNVLFFIYDRPFSYGLSRDTTAIKKARVNILVNWSCTYCLWGIQGLLPNCPTMARPARVRPCRQDLLSYHRNLSQPPCAQLLRWTPGYDPTIVLFRVTFGRDENATRTQLVFLQRQIPQSAETESINFSSSPQVRRR